MSSASSGRRRTRDSRGVVMVSSSASTCPGSSPTRRSDSRPVALPWLSTAITFSVRHHPMRVVVADDAPLVRMGLARLVAEHDSEVVGRAGDADAVLESVRGRHPDVAIVDIRMPPTHTDEGLRAAGEIRARYPDTAVLVLSQHLEPEYALRLVEEKPEKVGYLLKERAGRIEQLVDALQRVAAGECVVDRAVVDELLARRGRGHRAVAGIRRVRVALRADERECADPCPRPGGMPDRTEDRIDLRDARLPGRRHPRDGRVDRTEQRLALHELLDVEVPGAGEDDLRLRRGGPQPPDDQGQAPAEPSEARPPVRANAGEVALARRRELVEHVVAP